MTPARKAQNLLKDITILLSKHNDVVTLLESDDILSQEAQSTALAIRKMAKILGDSDKTFGKMVLAHRDAEGVFERAGVLTEVDGAPCVVMTFEERLRRSPRWKDIYLSDFEEDDRKYEADRVLAETSPTVSLLVKLEESA